MKKIIVLLLAFVLIFSFVACDNQKANQEDVTLTAWYYADGNAHEGYDLWASQVAEKYPYIHFEFEELPYDSGPQKFTVACATGTNPDLYFDTYSRCAAAIDAGLTLDLTDVRNANKKAFLGEQTDGVIDGEYQAIVTNTGAAYCIFVNTTLVKEAGLYDLLPSDKLTWSYDQFIQLLRGLKEYYPDKYPIELFAGSKSSDMWYYSWFIGNGVQLTNDELTATTFNVGENRTKAIETLNLFKQISDEGLCNPGVATTLDQDGHALWQSGKAIICHGAYSNTPGWYNAMEAGTQPTFEYEAFAMPTMEGKDIPYSGCFGSYSFIAFDSGDDAKNDAIRKAVEVYLQNPECQTIVTRETGRLSVMTDTVIEYKTDAIAEIMEKGATYSASYTISDFGVLEGWWTEFRDTFYPNLQELYTGKLDAGKVLDNWQEAGDKVIAKAN